MAHQTLSKALLAVGLSVVLSSSVLAADPKLMTGASAVMLANTCAGCHGTNGASVGPATPIIAGLSKDYFVETMEGFKEGEIPSTIMGRIAKGYSEEEFKQMADYFGNKPFIYAKQTFDNSSADKGAKLHDKYCEKCHSEGGKSAEDDSGVLAGQWVPYLDWTLADVINGDREAPKKMKKALSRLVKKEGDKGVAALLDYYARHK